MTAATESHLAAWHAECYLTPWQIEAPRVAPAFGSYRRVFPFGPLEELITGGHSATGVAGRLGVTLRQVYRWRADGLTERQADELALRAGFHPALVWPDWVVDAG